MKFYEYTGPETRFFITEDELDWHIAALREIHNDDSIEIGDFFREVDIEYVDLIEFTTADTDSRGNERAFWGDTSDETRQAMERAVLDISYEKLTDHGTWSNDHAPDCPICGMPGQSGDDGLDYACGHFIGVAEQCEGVAGELALVRRATDVIHVQRDTEASYLFARHAGLDDVMTAAEAAQRYGLAEPTVRQAINRSTLPARKSAGVWLIRRADAEARWGGKLRSIVLTLVSVGLALALWSVMA